MRTLRLIGIVLCLLMGLNVCGRAELDSEKGLFLTLQGTWERIGYGEVYVIGKKRVTIYQYTRATCFKSDKLDKKEFGELLIDIEMQNNGAGFTAISPNELLFRRHFSHLESPPEVCSKENRVKGIVPTKIFEHVWHTFNDYYAFFEERDVDWQAQYVALRDRVDDEMSKRELFAVMRKLLSPIDDGHVYLESSSEEFSPEKLRRADAVLTKGFKSQSKFNKYRKYVSWQMTRYEDILWSYLDKRSHQQSAGSSGDLLTWGTIDRHVGYLLVESMDYDVKAVQGIMDRVMGDLRDTEAMIIDVRFNGGGDDAVGLAIANRFTDKRRLAMTKTARSYRGETPRREAYLIPEGDTPYIKPVVVITGPNSASATETFLIAMRALPQVIQLGEATNGTLSDELYKSLPKGWEFTLSNEVYYDHTGVNHEVEGITPHIQASVFSLKDLETKRNSALETALEALAQ